MEAIGECIEVHQYYPEAGPQDSHQRSSNEIDPEEASDDVSDERRHHQKGRKRGRREEETPRPSKPQARRLHLPDPEKYSGKGDAYTF